MHPGFRASDLVGAPIQFPHLLEKRLEHVVIDRQDGSTPLAEEDTAGGRIGRNLQGTGPPAAVRTHSHIRGEPVHSKWLAFRWKVWNLPELARTRFAVLDEPLGHPRLVLAEEHRR
jgi:hypothetical protein